MDYEKKYNEALSQARFYYGNCPTEPEKKKLENIFPELRESEEDRIRMELIEYLRGDFDNITTDDTDRWITWIEKQKEQKHAPDDLQKSFEAGQTSIVDNPEQYGLCKKAEWREEDEKKRKGLIKGVEDRMGFGWAKDPFSREEYIAWLKSLRPSWKPSDEQMSSLKQARDYYMSGDIKYVGRHLSEIAEQLEKL